MSALPIARTSPSSSSSAQFFAWRLEPGADLYDSLAEFAAQNNLRAAYIATAVGSVTEVTIRFANQPSGTLVGPGHFEVVSLVGTVAISGSHVHISVSDGLGATIGGHLLRGSKVHSAGTPEQEPIDFGSFQCITFHIVSPDSSVFRAGIYHDGNRHRRTRSAGIFTATMLQIWLG